MARGRVEGLVREHHGHVVIIARQTKGLAAVIVLVARIDLVVEPPLSHQPLVGVLGGEVGPVIVVPEGVERFARVAPCQDVRVVVVVMLCACLF